jgi:DNA-binding transcriptional ArsR family regulator
MNENQAVAWIPAAWDYVSEMRRATALLHPLRLRILETLQEPDSASGLARRMLLAPQKVNYHLRKLERARFLKCVGQRKLGSKTERRYSKTALAYVLSPELLGQMGLARISDDPLNSSQLTALLSLAQAEMSKAAREKLSNEGGETLSFATEVSFRGPAERLQFEQDVRAAIGAIASRYAMPRNAANASESHRLICAAYAIPLSGTKRVQGRAEAAPKQAVISGLQQAKHSGGNGKSNPKRQVPGVGRQYLPESSRTSL